MTTAPKTARRSRLADVAALARVSSMTVVRVLRAPDKVAAATRARVESAIQRTGYTPDLVARALASRRSGAVGAIIPSLNNSLVAETIQGLTDALADAGLQILIGAVGFAQEREEALVRTFLARRVDALYVTGVTHAPAVRRLLAGAGIPIVEGANLTRRPIDVVVGFDNVAAAATAVSHLIDRGHAPIGHIGGPLAGNDRMRDRRLGYLQALRQAGRQPDESLIETAELFFAAGAAAMARLLSRRPDLRAVFCANDTLAAGALFECQRRGLAVPDRVAVAGFDDLDIAATTFPALTSVRVPRYDIGRRAGQVIRDRLAGKSVPARRIDLGFTFVARGST